MTTLAWMAGIFVLMIIFLVTLVLYEDSPKFQYRFKFCFYVVYVSFLCLFTIPFNVFQPGNVENVHKLVPIVRFCSKLLGVKCDASGTQYLTDEEPCVMVCNHQSIIDILVLSHFWPQRCAAVAKRELLYVFPFGLCAWMCGTVFIERSKKSSSIEQLKLTAERIQKEKTKLIIFPEGTRHTGKELLPFKKGAFHIAMQRQLPIVPIVISPYAFIDHEKEIFVQGCVKVSVLPPISTSDVTDVNDLIDTTRDLMNREFIRLSKCVKPEESD